jgi:hypothetical protein
MPVAIKSLHIDTLITAALLGQHRFYPSSWLFYGLVGSLLQR